MRKRLFWAGLSMALALVAIGPGPIYAAEKIRIATPAKANPSYYLAFLAAEENGYWKQNGLSGEWVPFQSGRSVIEALAAGAVDMGWAIVDTIIPLVPRGLPLVVIADLGEEIQWYFWVLSGSAIKKPEELKGAIVAVTRTGSGSHAMGRAVAKALGLEPQVKFVSTGGIPQALAALNARAVDTIVMPYLIMAKLKFEGQVRGVVAVSDYLPKPWLGLTLFTREELIEKRADALKGTIRALLQATDFVTKNRGWAIEKMKSESGYSEELGKEVHGALRFSKDGKISRPGLENVLNFMVEYGLVSKDKLPVIDKMYTTKLTG